MATKNLLLFSTNGLYTTGDIFWEAVYDVQKITEHASLFLWVVITSELRGIKGTKKYFVTEQIYL